MKLIGGHCRNGRSPLIRNSIPFTRMRSATRLRSSRPNGSRVVTDGEQRKYHNFWTYSVHGLPNTSPDGFQDLVCDVRRYAGTPDGALFRYKVYADRDLDVAKKYADVPLKQAVISPSALSLMYPGRRHPRLLAAGIHRRSAARLYQTGVLAVCFEKGAAKVRNRFHRRTVGGQTRSYGRTAEQFHLVAALTLVRFTPQERQRIGVHTCPWATSTRRIAPMSIMQTCCPACLNCASATSTSLSPGRRIRKHVLKIIGILKADQWCVIRNLNQAR